MKCFKTVVVVTNNEAPKPSICMRSSALNLRLASCSVSVPLAAHKESTSSMKMVLGAWNLAWKSMKQNFQKSHFSMVADNREIVGLLYSVCL